ncbi:hypothetical protein OGAPHI_003837 [Ogataea philodendri]|uniref:Uncharacterized protein n=1 Tax=Ogataea philodendri TaxID=1378263 RepID=A0A9P8P641_9ASCO|nr:uncharacterized protein OGAPHI_003837 [Ogataea philodendri]KAH3665649.1 hypothetical protein OGAPHI_003837 [Ogataea philodendri]
MKNTPENVSNAPPAKTRHWPGDLSAKSLNTTIEQDITAVVKNTKWMGTTVVAFAIFKHELSSVLVIGLNSTTSESSLVEMAVYVPKMATRDRCQNHENHPGSTQKRSGKISSTDGFVEQHRSDEGGVGDDGDNSQRRHDTHGGESVADKVAYFSEGH